MIEIPLTQGKVALVDDEDAHLAELSWFAVCPAGVWYAQHSTPHDANGLQRSIKLHRAVMGVTDPKVTVDHRDGNGLDCRRSNLRVATTSENCCNRGVTRRSRSGFKGVWRVAGGKWQAQIRRHRKLHYLGRFSTPEEAARAYDVAARGLHAEFAHLNFPDAGRA